MALRVLLLETAFVFLVISHRPEFLQKWTAVLEKLGDVASVASLAQLALRRDDAPPLLAVLDYGVIETSPGEILREWQQGCGKAKLILAGTGFPPQREMAALAAGVVACCENDMSAPEMQRVVAVAMQGGVWISRTTLPQFVGLLQSFSARPENLGEPAVAAMGSTLTSRQLDVARLVGQGENNKEIARNLGITDRTVKAHLTAIFKKLGTTDRLHLALYVAQHPL